MGLRLVVNRSRGVERKIDFYRAVDHDNDKNDATTCDSKFSDTLNQMSILRTGVALRSIGVKKYCHKYLIISQMLRQCLVGHDIRYHSTRRKRVKFTFSKLLLKISINYASQCLVHCSRAPYLTPTNRELAFLMFKEGCIWRFLSPVISQRSILVHQS